MKLLWPFKLQTRFFVAICAVGLAMGIFFVTVLYFHMQSVVLEETRARANLMLAEANSVQNYVQETLRPRMFSVTKGKNFVIEAMSSSYVSRKVMQDVAEKEDVIYRRVALNARNPDFDPDRLEKKIIEYFRDHPQKKEWEDQLRIDGHMYYFSARPVVFKKSCMRCHGDPERAPREIVKRYGTERGFGYQVGGVAGLVSVGYPIQSAFNMVKGTTLSFLVLYLCGIAIFFGFVQFIFHKFVTGKLSRLIKVMRRSMPENRDSDWENREEEEKEKGEDEIEQLISGLEGMANALGDARYKLEDYAHNLEEMVRKRTSELEEAAVEREHDVNLFLTILYALHTSDQGDHLVQKMMYVAGCRFNARASAYYSLQSPERSYSWPESWNPPELPRRVMDKAVAGEVVFTATEIYIPVYNNEVVWGILYLKIEKGAQRLQNSQKVLLALGQQMGIALENIKAVYELIYQKHLLESIFEGITDPLLLIDENARIILSNQGAKRVFHPEGQELLKEIKNILGQSDMSTQTPGMLGKAFEKNEPVVQEAVLKEERSFKFRVYPIPGQMEDSPGLAVCYARENTSEKRMLARLQRVERLSTVGKLSSGLAHEINNPLGTILCYVRLLQQNITEPAHLKDLSTIEQQAKRAHNIVQSLLDFARPKIKSGEYCDLNAQIEANISIFALQMEKKGVRIKKDLTPGLPEIQGDASAVEHILSNLILNAIDVAGENGWIEFATYLSRENERVVLKVQNSGPTISDQDIHRIFDPFFTTKEVGRGTGLGLTIVHSLVERLEAEIEVDNKAETAFYIRFKTKEDD